MQRRPRSSKNRNSGVQGAADPSSCVAEVMGTDLFTVTPDTVVGSALRLSSSRRIRHFLVIEGGNLAGIVCQTDLRQARQGALVGDCMKSPVLCIGPETTLGEAADIMRENSVGCLPVVTGAFLVGMVTRDRLFQILGLTSFFEEVDAAGGDPKPSCAACGSSKADVKPQFRAAMVDLCGDCAALLPAVEPLKAN
jgi:CBS domain-containing protein